ncbi:MAG: hypothetical protein JSU65_07505 [Candidatus Zixiibacteriota bacterium]|nr:MAG: hypothetical protein JSU65_07505 [candidate division Zixibacteria bacterium]
MAFEAFLGNPTSWLGVLGTVGLTVAGYLANRYVIPFLRVGKRRQYAQFVAVIADELVDELRLKYPDKDWLNHLDEALENLIRICGVSPDIARRAIKASAARH